MNWLIKKYYLRKYAGTKKHFSVPLDKLTVFADRPPVAPWAFIRAFNEMTTIEASLTSILPAINKGVIAFHDTDIPVDGTVEFILDFCKKHPGFIPYHYPHKVIPANDVRYQGEVNELNRLDTYYNAVLAYIPQGEWLIKIDVDQVYDPVKLKNSFRLPCRDTDIVEYGRINLHYADGKVWVNTENPLIEPGDHWLIKNHQLSFKFVSGYQPQTQRFFAYEHLHIPWQHRFIKTELLSWHFPAMKPWRNANKDFFLTQWQPLAQWQAKADNSGCYQQRLAEDMLDEDNILAVIRQFKLNNEFNNNAGLKDTE